MPGMPKAFPRMTFAVLRPTPGSAVELLEGARHLAAVPRGDAPGGGDDVRRLVAEEAGGADLPLELGRVGGGVGGGASRYLANSAGVTLFTRSSVHCAERMVATSSSSGVEKASEQRASG